MVASLSLLLFCLLSYLVICKKTDAAGIRQSVRYRSIPLQDWESLFQYLNSSCIDILVHSGAVLTGCRAVRNFEKLCKAKIILTNGSEKSEEEDITKTLHFLYLLNKTENYK
jgi:hypothetical protein